MARRRGRPGDYLMVDDYTGQVHYASKLKQDYWGNYAVKPLNRNLQEIASPLKDPAPVAVQRGPDYERYNPCDLKYAPIYVGLTNVKTSQLSAALQSPAFSAVSDQGIGDMEVGCSFVVR